MARFSAKRVLITGATSGIGLAGAKRIDSEGGWVIATGRDPGRLASLRRQLSDRARVIDNDASDPLTGAALAEAIDSSGGLDGLWLNAGYAAVGELSQVDAAAFDRMMATNVRGPVLQMAALAGKLNAGASVVVTASTSAYEGAAALGERNIRVNALVPGPIDTPFRHFMRDEVRREFEASVVSRLALHRQGTAAEAADVALFLLSDAASFVSGSQYVVDGGLTLR
ncbi:SDR family oxidoreductase [Klebsiella michiganensis]|uniref:SDR family oxidoreductase n=1 Tax=Klebsiella michiganensis TaxID=1134687 RepID=UPI000DFC2E76|nr:SDR family oxidoreductase [Klebsiella michiganensis]TXV06382.1 SDR family oxidoreductase [Klebsiella michiganensis]STR62841.1 3-oxoacyl-ACP reductase [Klebsiella michiganensis]HDS8141103.1 SDR family oxidoreductase [Klebsiella michiganensis]HDT1977688.1 SDR family oxidoreductase [Klebsiella michiganensis]HDV9732288.1 SDR family oxidoreductase [Klebsiella michiganensis]